MTALAVYDSSKQGNCRGEFSTQTTTGAKITKAEDGRHVIGMRRVKAVGIENLMDVEVHGISTVANSRSHYVRFQGGGELRYSYNSAGQLLEFSWENLDFVLTMNDEIMFSRRS